MKTTSRFWIMEQTPNGGHFASVGMDERVDLKEALRRLKSWQKTFPDRKCSLALITTAIIAK